MKHIATTIENDLYFDLIRVKDEKTWPEFFKMIVEKFKDEQ